jgi:pimeloyl-ACP methyl ester carboxylesterase
MFDVVSARESIVAVSPQHRSAAPSSATSATAGFLGTDWNPRDVPDGTVTRNVVLRTDDGAAVTGSLYQRGQPDTVVCVMHPREFMACHYLIPDVIEGGCAAWSQSPRSVGNDLRLEHEFALFDVAAGITFLCRSGFKRIVLLGNSGGSGLYAFYVQQALREPARRIERTPGGRATNLDRLSMPQVDGFIFVAPHPGQGMLLLGCIDPSVTDERDALSVEPSLDPFDLKNGFADPPTTAKYADDFVTRYRAAQHRRVAKLDGIARELIGERMAARRRSKEGGSAADQRRGAHTPIMTIWRTDADLRCFDLSLDPSDRAYGSLWGKDPFASNFGAVGFARNCTPEAWLSTWSGISSHAALAKTTPSIEQPVLLVEYTGDASTFPTGVKQIFSDIGTAQKTHIRIRGDHHGRALTRDEEPGRYIAGRAVRDWLLEFCAR